MVDTPRCPICGRPLWGFGVAVCRVGEIRYHAYCYLTRTAPSAPRFWRWW